MAPSMAPVAWMMEKAPPQMKMKKIISAVSFIPLGTDSNILKMLTGVLST